MKEPISAELTREERASLDAARDWVSPSAADASRVKGKLWAALPLATTSADGEPSLPKARGLAFKQGAGLLALGLGVGLVTGYGLGQQVNPSSPAPSSVMSGVILQPPHEGSDTGRALGSRPSGAVATLAAPVVEPAGSGTRPPLHGDAGTRRLAASPARRTGSSPIDEVEWVRRIQRALAKREPQLALALLRELDEALPNGRLLEERRAADVIARCQIAPDGGPERAAAFARDFARSVHLARIRAACGLESLDE